MSLHLLLTGYLPNYLRDAIVKPMTATAFHARRSYRTVPRLTPGWKRLYSVLTKDRWRNMISLASQLGRRMAMHPKNDIV